MIEINEDYSLNIFYQLKDDIKIKFQTMINYCLKCIKSSMNKRLEIPDINLISNLIETIQDGEN